MIRPRKERLEARCVAVLSNQPNAAGLEKAAAAGISTQAIHHRDFATRAAFDAAMIEAIDRFEPKLIVMAGFMRIVTSTFVDHYAGRMINIHPSILPAFPGLHTHRQALASGAAFHGATVHFVTSTLDVGPIIIQAKIPVLAADDEHSLAAKVLRKEHEILPTAINWMANGRISVEGDLALLDGHPLAPLSPD